MSNHFNFLGSSIWVTNHNTPKWDQIDQPMRLYRPIIIAAYSSANPSIGLRLYGINIFRRGHCWKGRLIISLSGLFLILNLINSNVITLDQNRFYSFVNWLVAIHLYSLESPYFKLAIREGWRPARWWIPVCFLVLIIFLGRFLIS